VRGETVEIAAGVAMPLVGIGTWQAQGDDAYRAVRVALDDGYRHIDTATMYRNEDQVGRAIADSGLRREELFVTTKLTEGDVGREEQAIETSLRRLGLDVVDLWLIHWPPRSRASPATWSALRAQRDRGLARAIGVSNYSLDQIDELIRTTGEAPAVNQIRFGPALWNSELVAAHGAHGVVVEGYSPFRTTDLRARVLVDIAARHGRSPAQVVIRWHVQHGIVAIPKSTRPDRIAANFDVWDFALSDDDMERIDGLGAA
jgi:2,5-diketo-D-gluconate reductase A